MFERWKLGGGIHTQGDKLTASGSPVDNKHARVLYEPLTDQAIKDVKT